MKEIKSPSQTESNTENRTKQYEEPARTYVNLLTGEVCLEGYEHLPNHDVADPAVRVTTEKLNGASKRPTGIGIQK